MRALNCIIPPGSSSAGGLCSVKPRQAFGELSAEWQVSVERPVAEDGRWWWWWCSCWSWLPECVYRPEGEAESQKDKKTDRAGRLLLFRKRDRCLGGERGLGGIRYKYVVALLLATKVGDRVVGHHNFCSQGPLANNVTFLKWLPRCRAQPTTVGFRAAGSLLRRVLSGVSLARVGIGGGHWWLVGVGN